MEFYGALCSTGNIFHTTGPDAPNVIFKSFILTCTACFLAWILVMDDSL